MFEHKISIFRSLSSHKDIIYVYVLYITSNNLNEFLLFVLFILWEKHRESFALI